MKITKTQLKKIIKEAVRGLNESTASDDYRLEKNILPEMYKRFQELEETGKRIEKEVSSFGSPGLLQAFNKALKAGLGSGPKLFNSSASDREIDKYFKTIGK